MTYKLNLLNFLGIFPKMAIFDLELYIKINKHIYRDVMILKKISIGIFLLTMLNGCAQNTALLGPAYTMATTGNAYQASLSYGSDQMITKITGKSTGENIKKMLTPREKDSEFKKLVKRRVQETRKKLNFSNQ
jgi:tetrahydromethanopterin S-methyltransferase subunit G